jgi:hypothetical protein
MELVNTANLCHWVNDVSEFLFCKYTIYLTTINIDV